MTPKISSGVFLLILLFFLLPWLSVSCGAINVQFDGTELIFGKRGLEPQSTGFGSQQLTQQEIEQVENRVGSGIYALAAFVLAAIGIIVFFVRDNQAGKALRSTLGVLGIISLLVLKFKTENDLTSGFTDDPDLAEFGIQGPDLAVLVQVNWEIGFWLAFFGFIVVVALQFIPIERLFTQRAGE